MTYPTDVTNSIQLQQRACVCVCVCVCLCRAGWKDRGGVKGMGIERAEAFYILIELIVKRY